MNRALLGWRIEHVEDGQLAVELVEDIVAEQGRPQVAADERSEVSAEILIVDLYDMDSAARDL